mgnify:CR=1 FL=1
MPHLRELVKLHEDQPFAIIGVNTGDSETDFRNGVEKFDVSWISAYQGEKSPIADLYQCGASVHPGGGVTGVPGHNAAQVVLRKLGRG